MSKKKDEGRKRGTNETARRIWLAGIGAYGRAFTEAQEALKDVTGKGSEVFDELVQKGEMIEMVVGQKRKDIMSKAGVPDIDLPNFDTSSLDMSERIKKMRSRLSRGDDDIEARLEALEDKMDRILALLEPRAAKRKAPAKKATKKASTKKAVTKKRASPKKTATQRTKKTAPKK